MAGSSKLRALRRRVGPWTAGGSQAWAAGRLGCLPPSWRGWLVAGLIALTTAGPATRLALGARMGEAAWLPQETVAKTVALGGEPVVAVGADGTVWVAWQDGGEVAVARDSGSGWSAPERVGAGFGVDLAVDGVTPHVVFLNELEDRVDLVYSFRQAQGWALPRTISSTVAVSSNPALAMAGGTRYVAWADAERLFLGRSNEGATWSVAPVLINGVPVAGTAPDLAATADGSVDLVWHADVEGVARIRHATRHGNRWSLVEDLTTGEVQARMASVVLLSQGDRLVSWLEDAAADRRRIQAVVGETEWWSDTATVSGSDDVAGPPQVAGGAHGADVAWPLTQGGVRYRARGANGNWSAPEVVTPSDALDVTLAASAAGAFVAWSAPVGGSGWDILLRRRARESSATPTPSDPASPTATVALPSPTTTSTPSTTPMATATGLSTAGSPAPSGTPPPSPTPPEATATQRPATATSSPITPSTTPTSVAASVTPTGQDPGGTPTSEPTSTALPQPDGRTLFLPFLYTDRRAAVGGDGLVRTADRSQARASAERLAAASHSAAPPHIERHAAAAQRADSGATEVWSAPEEIARLPGDTWQIALAVDSRGRPHVLWEESGSVLHSARDAGGWWPARQVAFGEAPTLALDEGGTLHALFANSFDGNHEIYHISFANGAWSLPVNVSHTSTFSVGPVLRHGQGSIPLVATWAELRPEGPMVYYGFWDGQDWHSKPVVQARGLGPALAVDDLGPALAWHSRAEQDRPFEVYAARGASLQGGEWSLPENVSDTQDEDSVVASLALDPRTWHVAWQEGPPPAAGVAYARRYQAGWGEVESLADVSSGPPKVLAAPGGAREVVWLAGTAVWSARGIGEGAWQTELVPPAAAGAVAAAVAGDTDGGLHLVWAAGIGEAETALYYARRLGCPACRVLMPFAYKRR